MLWVYAEDSYYYENINELEKYIQEKASDKSSYEKVFVFTGEQLDEVLCSGNYEQIIVSPYLPAHFRCQSPFFGIIKVPNKYGLLTSSEKKSGLTEYEKLHKETGLTIEESPVTFKDMAGNTSLKSIAEKLSVKYSMGEIPKAVFLAGVPGTGKSFFAQCLAGETNRLLVSFNLTKIMYGDNPIESFDKIVDYLSKQNQRYLLWIDEIEKMFTESEKSEHIKNKFLTFLNDLGITIQMDAFVVLTANNVSGILEKNPELVRGGRVETFAKIFMDFPKVPTSTSVCELYAKKRNSKKERIERLSYYLKAIKEKKANTDIWIYQYAQHVYSHMKTLTDGLCFDNVDMLIKSIQDNIDNEHITNCLEKMKFPLDADYIVDYIDRNYCFVCNPVNPPENFPYVQAEIKEIVTQLYYKHLEVNLYEHEHEDDFSLSDILDQLMRENIPIGEAGGLGIDKMKGNQNKFSVVLD